MDPLGHLQATGLDAAGRKQYLYHERWRAHRDRGSSTRWSIRRAAAAAARRVAADLRPAAARRSRRRARRQARHACAVRLLDLGFFRIGSEDYAERNESYGLTTMLAVTSRSRAGRSSSTSPPSRGSGASRRWPTPIAGRRGGAESGAAGAPQLLAYKEGARWQEFAPRRSTSTSSGPRRRLQREGLPHLECDRARGGGAGRTGRDARRTARASRRRGDQGPSPPISATPQRCAAPRTWTRAWWTASRRARRSRPRSARRRATDPTSHVRACGAGSSPPCSSCSR